MLAHNCTDINYEKSLTGVFMLRKIVLLLLIVSTSWLCGCSEKTGALKDPLPPFSYVTPTISNLAVVASSVSKCSGGIVRLTCEWTTPNAVATATAYLGFVKSIQNTVTEPVGVIGSDVATISRNIVFAMQPQTASDPACIASDSAAFYERFRQPNAIPTKGGTSELAGMWSAEIPLPREDIISAPLGVHQMVFYMSINGIKTNTLSFEMTFVP